MIIIRPLLSDQARFESVSPSPPSPFVAEKSSASSCEPGRVERPVRGTSVAGDDIFRDENDPMSNPVVLAPETAADNASHRLLWNRHRLQPPSSAAPPPPTAAGTIVSLAEAVRRTPTSAPPPRSAPHRRARRELT